jgi:phosphoribosylformylglycinamidine cyclo-ligase
LLGIGYYANVLRIAENLGLAISTDSVGSKVLLAELLGKYDTLGIDCIAMNANDVLCVGAEPLAMVDYVAVQEARPAVLEQLGRGLHEGAIQANITIPGGELAQLPEVVKGAREGEGLDLVGTCIGTVALDRLVLGEAIEPSDVVLGLASTGVHSNGLTLARRVLFDRAGYRPDQTAPELGREVGLELLEPTRIYVRPVWRMLTEGLPVRGLYHITGDGLLNLNRGDRPIGFDLEWLPEPQPIFHLIARCGDVAPAEMYRVFNMGVGFCVVLPETGVARAQAIAGEFGIESWVLGRAVSDPQKRVWLRPVGLVGEDEAFA